ncbi:MAG TPA: acyl-CoA dehydratase activase [Longimicrobiales bacterium]|nr:acyl-CoA dehydratase activase [Longimicrobiales bacterium]
METTHLGVDVGSTTVKVVALDSSGRLLTSRYLRANGRPHRTALEASRDVQRELGRPPVASLGLSGSGGGGIARIVGGMHVNELVAQTRALGLFHPEARTVIEMGGQDSKFLAVRWDPSAGRMTLEDFSMNALCAAGTGAFLDQQAERLGISIDREFARIALSSGNPARVAGRCTVFAKSDMIHLQQEGAPLADILAGLCLALARNFRSLIGRGKAFPPPVLFQGGVAKNGAVVRAFEEVLGLRPGELVVPVHHDVMAALGAAFVALDEASAGRGQPFLGFGALEESLRAKEGTRGTLPPLRSRPQATASRAEPPAHSPRVAAHLGVDVGSISTNLVLLDDEARVLARRYLPTAGRPVEAVRRGLAEIGAELGGRVDVVSAGVTGSGRHLTGHYVGADVVRNEITAQARAAATLDPEVDTVFEVGGQDSKYIRVVHGAVVDFAMNNACAAGTGSFLEEQGDRLGISIRDDFASMALSAPSPVCLGERCTVFMESDLVHHQQCGAAPECLTAGLAYSVVQNYLNRVVAGRPVGERILFQGGVAGNAAVASAFEAVLGRPVRVPPHHDVTGAIGAALLAREEMREEPSRRTRFRGFDARDRRYEAVTFVCRACTNLCEVKRISVAGEPPIFFGARCDRFEDAGRTGRRPAQAVPDLFAEREALLLAGWRGPKAEDGGTPSVRSTRRPVVGIPRVLAFHEMLPYWIAFLDSLGMDVALSTPTNPVTVGRTQQAAAMETCFPVRLVLGHVLELLERDVDHVLLPSVMDREDHGPGQVHNHYCPLIPASAHMVAAQLDADVPQDRILRFTLRMGNERARRKDLAAVADRLGLSSRRTREADRIGRAAQARFEAELLRRGREVMADLRPGVPAAVIVGRPYNTCDPGLCLDLPRKLRSIGVLPIPLDLLPAADVDLTDRHPDMYWRSGQRILGAARIVAADERLQAIYLTSFDCGPDSFLIGYFRREMGSKPFLELEVDDHTAEAGMVTRCEAFFDSLGLRPKGAA